MKYAQYMFTFLMGYFLYAFVEVVSRGYTHWTMCLTGGAALTMLYFISRSPAMTLIRCCIIGAAAITAIEFAVGIFDNLIMHWHVWIIPTNRSTFSVRSVPCLLFYGESSAYRHFFSVK